jgi:SWI/SNF-related matrix-associated actin-dependent regulator of chromatin subfamily A protein 2/4
MQKASREKQLKSIFQWRKKLLEAHWAIRDARITRNRGVAKYHERMLREFSKRKDDDRSKRMEALKNNDVERYRQILLEQQTSVPGDAAQRYNVLSSFLSQTEEYLYKLGGKITATKSQQQVEEAANAAAAAARAQVLLHSLLWLNETGLSPTPSLFGFMSLGNQAFCR